VPSTGSTNKADILPISFFPLATAATRSALEASQATLAVGVPFLVTLRTPGTLKKLTEKAEEFLTDYFAIFRMPHLLTANPNQSYEAPSHGVAEGRTDAVTMVLMPRNTQATSPASLANARSLLEQHGILPTPAARVEDLQPGGAAIARFDPALAITIRGLDSTLNSSSGVTSFLARAVEGMPRPDLEKLLGEGNALDKQQITSDVNASTVLFAPIGGNGRNRDPDTLAIVVVGDEKTKRFVLGIFNTTLDKPAEPHCPPAGPGAQLLVEDGDLVHRSKPRGPPTPALRALRHNPKTRDCHRGCGAHNLHCTSGPTADPSLPNGMALTGPEGLTLHITAILNDVKGSGLRVEDLHLDKAWDALDNVSKGRLTSNPKLLAARTRVRACLGRKPSPGGTDDPLPTAKPDALCLRSTVRHGEDRYVFCCRHCLAPGHHPQHCVWSPERARVLGDSAPDAQMRWLQELEARNPSLYAAAPPRAAVSLDGTGDSLNRKVLKLLLTPRVNDEAPSAAAPAAAAPAAAAPAPARAAAAPAAAAPASARAPPRLQRLLQLAPLPPHELLQLQRLQLQRLQLLWLQRLPLHVQVRPLLSSLGLQHQLPQLHRHQQHSTRQRKLQPRATASRTAATRPLWALRAVARPTSTPHPRLTPRDCLRPSWLARPRWPA